MQSSYGPNSADEPSLLYKLQRKIKVFNTNNSLPNRGYNLVACSSKYGIIFVGSPDGVLSVYQLKDLIDKDCEPQHVNIQLREQPTHIAVSCDQELLAVTGGQLLSIYNISNFQNANPSSLDIKCDVSPTAFVSGLQWNPITPDNLAIVYYNGTLLVANIGTTPQIKKVESKARCLCWSPKGKQLVTGNNDGTLTQYKPDLTLAKNIPAPNLFEGSATIEALAVYWISTFMFAVVYKNAMDNSRPYVTIVNTPKATPPQCLNYEDICYSMGSSRPWYYYLQGIPPWCIIMAASSNSMEIATLGSREGENWVQWCQSDEARPELPLTDKKIENFPIGVSIDTCAIHQLPWGENSVLPHMPLLHVLSHNGLLTIFNVINLNKDAPQVCMTPQQLSLPSAAMTSTIPGEAPPVVQPPITPAATLTPVQVPPTQLAPQQPQAAVPPPQYSASILNIPKPSINIESQINQQYLPVQAKTEPPQIPEIKPSTVVQSAAASSAVVQPPQSLAPAPQTAQQVQENAALKAEQERLNEIKVNQELKNMLVKEVNDFQMELYKFMVKTRETQAKLQNDINSINTNFNLSPLDSEQLKKDCSLDNLRGAIIQLKLELVRACAVIAEARTHTEAKDQHQWTQADPLTTKRVASVKKLAYYVQSQLEQAQKALNYKWNEAITKDANFNKPGHRMIRPILDDVYQPLVKQQEILSRQQAVLRTLRNTLKECDVMPILKTKSLLRSTPFKNKDPLSKLTKNILNMSIEPEKPKDSLLSAQKLEALRDILSNHKTVKIKPVNVEMRQHLATMKLNYEKSLKEKAQAIPVKSEPTVQPQIQPTQPQTKPAFTNKEVKIEPKQEMKPSPINVPSFTPVGGMTQPIPGLMNVVRTLFTDEPKSEVSSPIQLPQPKPVHPVLSQQYSPITPVALSSSPPANTRSVLKDLLQNKQANNEAKANEAKNDANTFMGQPICSPSSFTFSSTTSAPSATRTTAFTAKPISDITNMFTKFQPQTFVPESKSLFAPEFKSPIFEPKSQTFAQGTKTQSLIQEPKIQTSVITGPKSFETGEPETSDTKTLQPKTDKPTTVVFGLKSSTPLPKPNVPDVLKTTQDLVKPIDKILPKPVEKENQSENLDTEVNQAKSIENKEMPKLQSKTSVLGVLPENIAHANASTVSDDAKANDIKTEVDAEIAKVMEKPTPASSSASSIFAAGNANIDSVITPISTPKSDTDKSESDHADTTASPKSSIFSSSSNSSAASIFGAAVASQTTVPTTTTSQASSIFASAVSSSPPSSSSIFGLSTKGSIFGSSQTSVFGSTTSPTATTESKPSVFSTPTPASATPDSPSSVFGSAVTTSQSGSIFGSSVFATATTTSVTSVFGSPVTSVFGATSTQSSVFGGTTTSTSIFSSTATTTQASLFSSVTTTSTPSAFTSTTTQASSPFGSSTTTTTSSLFGSSGGSVFAAAGTGSNQTSVFGVPPATTQASSLFSSATAVTTQASVFGAATTPTTQTSVFGVSTGTTQASVFGSTNPSSVFGTTPTTTAQSSTSLFGGAESNLFAAASISTTSAPSQTSGGSIFGGSSSGSVFGGNTNVFGGKTAFGQSNQASASIFGGGGATSFGQQPTNNFWSGGNANTEGGFGSASGGFGQQATTQASSIFGGTTGGSFSTPSPSGQAFGSPQQGVFGSPQQQSGTASAFGGSPTFGSKPVFGGTPSFGSPTSGFGTFGGFNKSPSSGFGAPPAFGGSATFGSNAPFGSTSPGKVFGGGTPAPSFTATQSNATFESLANQNTLTFGNLAQQSGQPPQQAPAFNATSPSFTGWRG